MEHPCFGPFRSLRVPWPLRLYFADAVFLHVVSRGKFHQHRDASHGPVRALPRPPCRLRGYVLLPSVSVVCGYDAFPYLSPCIPTLAKKCIPGLGSNTNTQWKCMRHEYLRRPNCPCSEGQRKLGNAGSCRGKSQSRGGVSGLRSECREVPLQHLPNSEVRFNGTNCEQTDQGFIFPGACILAFPSNRNVKVLTARNLGWQWLMMELIVISCSFLPMPRISGGKDGRAC